MKTTNRLHLHYAYKLISNIVNVFANLVINIFIPKALGPESYGIYSYLSHFFGQVTGFLDGGSSSYFYTEMSKKSRNPGLLGFYFLISILSITIIILGSSILIVSPVRNAIWPGQIGRNVILGACLGACLWFFSVITKVLDAYEMTGILEILRVVQKIFYLFIILGLFSQNLLTLGSNYYVLILLNIIFPILMIKSARHSNEFKRDICASREDHIQWMNNFYCYCRPLFIYAVISIGTALLDRWILQRNGGNIEQGYFGLSTQISSVCFLFTSALTPLMTREYASAFGDGDLKKIAFLIQRYPPILYSLASFFSCFIAVKAQFIVTLVGRSGYENAAPVIALMALYPIHQTYGQLSGSLYFAMQRTKEYSLISILFSIIGVGLTFILVGGVGFHSGLNLGAMGLALKTILFQFVMVNILLFRNYQFLGLSFKKIFLFQLFNPLLLLSFAFSVEKLISNIGIQSDFIQFFLEGILYVALVILVLLLFPSVFGLLKKDINRAKEIVFKRFSYGK